MIYRMLNTLDKKINFVRVSAIAYSKNHIT